MHYWVYLKKHPSCSPCPHLRRPYKEGTAGGAKIADLTAKTLSVGNSVYLTALDFLWCFEVVVDGEKSLGFFLLQLLLVVSLFMGVFAVESPLCQL